MEVKGILPAKNGMNLYRGCPHGCIYGDFRSRCYYMEHAFEDIDVKENAVELLKYTLRHKRKKCMIGTGSMTDPYIPLGYFAHRTPTFGARALLVGDTPSPGKIALPRSLRTRLTAWLCRSLRSRILHSAWNNIRHKFIVINVKSDFKNSLTYFSPIPIIIVSNRQRRVSVQALK